jgi:hypothetical protein
MTPKKTISRADTLRELLLKGKGYDDIFLVYTHHEWPTKYLSQEISKMKTKLRDRGELPTVTESKITEAKVPEAKVTEAPRVEEDEEERPTFTLGVQTFTCEDLQNIVEAVEQCGGWERLCCARSLLVKLSYQELRMRE